MVLHSYEPVALDENDPPPSYEADGKQVAWHQKPSILWLLPVFLIFNLAMGATSMPRMNVVTSLICRNTLAQDLRAHPQGNAMNVLQRRHGGGMSDATMAKAGNYSAIIIGDYNPQCATKDVESATAMFNLWGNLITGLIAAAVTPFWGKLSDHFGRVKPLAASTMIIFVSEVVVVLVAKFPDTLSLGWMYLAFVLEGISGSFILIMALASSYAADCTQSKDRNVSLGLFHGSMFFGMAAGPAFGGYLGMSSGKSNPLLVFYTGLGMKAFGILFLALVPESLQLRVHDRRPSRVQLHHYLQEALQGSWAENLRHANPVRHLRILSASHSNVDKSTYRNLLSLAMINTILFGAVMGAMNIMMLYSEFKFGWGNNESGIFLSTVNIFRTIATVVVLPAIIMVSRRFSASKGKSSFRHTHGNNTPDESPSKMDSLDINLLRISIFSDTIGYIGYAISPTGALYTVSGAIASLGAIGLAISEASMTKLLPASQTGELLGALGLLQGMARIIAPTVTGLVYSWTTETLPQLVFWGIAVFFAIAGLLTLFLTTGTVESLRQEQERGEDLVPLQVSK